MYVVPRDNFSIKLKKGTETDFDELNYRLELNCLAD